MAVTLQTRNEAAGDDTAVPASLVQGELAVNTQAKKLWVGDNVPSVIELLGGAVAEGAADNDQLRWNSTTNSWESFTPSSGGEAVPPGSVAGDALRWDGSAWVVATGFGIDGSGNVTPVGTVDGRDVAADGTAQDTHIADATIHFTEASIDHTAITNVGTNTHAQIDTHIADATIHWADSASADPQARTNAGWVDSVQVVNAAAAAQAQPTDLQTLTQAEYDGLTPDANTLYFIVG